MVGHFDPWNPEADDPCSPMLGPLTSPILGSFKVAVPLESIEFELHEKFKTILWTSAISAY